MYYRQILFLLFYGSGIIPKRHNSCLNLLKCNVNILNLISLSHFLKQELRPVGQFNCTDFSCVGIKICQATTTSTSSIQLLRSQKTKWYFLLHPTMNKIILPQTRKAAIGYNLLPHSKITSLLKNPDDLPRYFSGKK